LADVVWGELDALFIDLPPGTGDEPLSVAQLLPDLDGVVVVTIPSEVSQLVVKKAITFARRVGLPVIGVVENMGEFVCPDCGAKTAIFQSGGGKRIAEETGVPFLGSIPLDPKVSAISDKGVPFIVENTDSAATKSFMEIVEKIEAFLKNKEKSA
jgi:ATP-binding protein involved in chromosome partitioning